MEDINFVYNLYSPLLQCYLCFKYPQREIIKFFILPFDKEFIFIISPLTFLCISVFVIMGSSNAVNLTDGLDGLAILPSVLIAAGLGLIAYAMGNQIIANYLFIPFHPLTGELIVFCGALIGAGIGFLWYNTYPAQIFMGDLGSLTLGGILGTLAVLVRHEIVFAIMAGVFCDGDTQRHHSSRLV